MNYKVSVIIPCYNLENYIKDCILSICNQTYRNLEILIIDDGSSDGSWDKIHKLEKIDKRIKSINQANGGVSKARNRGIAEATGDMIMFVDGDDYIDSMYIEKMISAMNVMTDMVVAGITFKFKDYNTVVSGDVFNCDVTTFFDKHYLNSVVKRTIFGPVNKLFRKEIIQNHNIRFIEDISIREDGLFVLEFLKHIKFISGIADAGYNYIQHGIGSSLVGRFNENELEINAFFYKELLSLFPKTSNKTEVISRLNPMFLNMDFTSIMKLYSSDKYSFVNGLKYIYKVKKNRDFVLARKQLFDVNCYKALKYYRPMLFIHIICLVKQIIYKRRK